MHSFGLHGSGVLPLKVALLLYIVDMSHGICYRCASGECVSSVLTKCANGCFFNQKKCHGSLRCISKMSSCPHDICSYRCEDGKCVPSRTAMCSNGCYLYQKKCPDGSCKTTILKCERCPYECLDGKCVSDKYETCANGCFYDQRKCPDGSCKVLSAKCLTQENTQQGKGPDNTGTSVLPAVIGVLIAVVIVVALIAIGVWCWRKKADQTGKTAVPGERPENASNDNAYAAIHVTERNQHGPLMLYESGPSTTYVKAKYTTKLTLPDEEESTEPPPYAPNHNYAPLKMKNGYTGRPMFQSFP